MEGLEGDATNIYNLSKLVLDQAFSLPLMDFVLKVDEILPTNLSDRLHHIVKIVKQAFEIDIEPHRMYDMLSILKQKSRGGKNMVHHNKNIEDEIYKYASNVNHLSEHPSSTPFCLPFVLQPQTDQCPQCNKSLSSSSKYRTVTLYLANGTSKSATVVSYICRSKYCFIEIFPNFINNLSNNGSYSFTTKQFFSNTEFIYLGGKTAFEILILKQYSSLLSNGHLAFDSFTRAFNELSDQFRTPLDRRLFERIFIIYELIQYQLFMGTGEKFLNNCSAFFPRNIYTGIDKFIKLNYDHFYKTFVQFWSTHNTFNPCHLSSEAGNTSSLCSAAIICDGHMKIRRRLCSNSNIPMSLPIHFTILFNELMVGCSHTPSVNEKLCQECKDNNVVIEPPRSRYRKKQKKDFSGKLDDIEKKYTNDMSTLGCNVHKEDVFIDSSIRACGILVTATNCQVIIGFEEILRSESRKQIIQALANLYTINPSLSKIVIYDAGCLLAKSVRAYFDDESKTNEMNDSVGLKALREIRFFVDRFHLSNHKEKYCHEHLNLDLDDTLKDINSSSCEQINSWVKSYGHMLSNMNEYKFAGILLILFHLRNCSHTKLSNRWVDVKQALIEKRASSPEPYSTSN